MQSLLPRRPPLLSLIGVGVALLGLGLDVIAHVASGEPLGALDHVHGFSPAEATAHLVGMAGMVTTMAGILVDGARGHRRRRVTAARHPASGVRSARPTHRSSNHALR